VNQAIKAAIAVVILLSTVPVIGEELVVNAVQASIKQDQLLFDPSHGVILEGDAARHMAEMCGAEDDSKQWIISLSAIKSVEQELAPLLANDLKRVRSSAVPNQYYRQYAAGTFANRETIFVNGFHESHLSTFNDASWRNRPVAVLDGADYYWCAIYIPSMKRHFVTYKGGPQGVGDMHVSFHGEA